MKKIIFVLCLLSAALSPSLRAQTLIITPNGASSEGEGDPLQGFTGTLGTWFTVNSGWSVTLSAVGWWDLGADGIQDTNTTISVGLFTTADNFATASLVSGTQLSFAQGNEGTLAGPASSEGRFRTLDLSSPVTLTSGTYGIVSWGFGAADSNYNGLGTGIADFDTLGGAINYDSVRYDLDGGMAPLTLDGDGSINQYLAATFVATASATAVPEPATYAALSGLLALFGATGMKQFRRHRKTA